MADVQMPKENFSQNLRLAMDEIIEICRKRDCMGLIMLQSEQHAEFKLHIDASWSMLEYFDVPGEKDKFVKGIRFKMRKDPELHRKGEFSVGAIYSLRELCANFFLAFDDLRKSWAEHFETEHVRGPIHNEGRTNG